MPKGLKGFQKGHKLNIGNQYAKGNPPNKTSFKKGRIPSKGFKKGLIPWNKNKHTGIIPRSIFKKGMTTWNKGKKLPQQSGKNHPRWKGGITPINEAIRKSLEYKLWRKAVFEQNNYTCQECGIKSKKGLKVVLEAHHIKSQSKYPKLRFVVNNGITLCKNCHSKIDYCRKRFTLPKEYAKQQRPLIGEDKGQGIFEFGKVA